MDGEGHGRPHAQVRTGLRVGVPTDPRVPGLLAGAGVLVDDPEAVVFEHPGPGTEQPRGHLDQGRLVGRGARDRRHLGDVAHVVRERLPTDRGVGIVEDHGAAHLGERAGQQLGLLVFELVLQLGELSLRIEAPHHREPVLGKERLDAAEVGSGEDPDLAGEGAAGRRAHALHQTGARVWVNTSTRRMRPSSVSSNMRHSGVRRGVPSTSTVSDSSANAIPSPA